MVTKVDFTAEEWVTLRAALDAALYGTAVADQRLYDTEAKAARRLEKYAMPFIHELLDRGTRPREDDTVAAKVTAMPLEQLFDEALTILRRKVSRDEIDALRRTLQALARAVAEADESVDISEQRFIAALDDLLRNWKV